MTACKPSMTLVMAGVDGQEGSTGAHQDSQPASKTQKRRHKVIEKGPLRGIGCLDTALRDDPCRPWWWDNSLMNQNQGLQELVSLRRIADPAERPV